MPGVNQNTPPIFPPLSYSDVLHFQFSSWYTRFRRITMKSTVVPLPEDFTQYLLSDGVHIPKGCDGDGVGENDNLSSDDEDEDDGEDIQHFSFPEVDAQIREAISSYGAVFPKLNFSSPKESNSRYICLPLSAVVTNPIQDASWILPSSSPMKCTLPSEVYMLLKSSDFVLHDVSKETVFESCLPDDAISSLKYDLELVLRKWYSMDPSREFRCFVRGGRLLGISQRDTNFYDYMNDSATKYKVVETIESFWNREIKNLWPTYDYIFDLVLTRDLASGHIVDFNPFASYTDALLFTYEELQECFTDNCGPILKTVDSPSHEAANRSSPSNVHNMVPFEMLSQSAGQTLEEFTRSLQDGIRNDVHNT